MKQLLSILMASILTMPLFAQNADEQTADTVFTPTYKYRVTLTDKKATEHSVRRPEEFLSQKALARRERQGIKVDKTDLPVCRVYLEGIASVGVKVLMTSKWNNTALVQCEDTTLMNEVSRLPYVKEVHKVATYVRKNQLPTPKRYDRTMFLEKNIPAPDANEPIYGTGQVQIDQLNGVLLHDSGFRGKGMTIAILDAGYLNADIIPALQSVNILGTRDFVCPESDIYAESSHGMQVLSCMAMNTPHSLVGTAPEAAFWLIRSEDSGSEQMVEEDYWAAAIEFADSVGADVVNSSLGYTVFDNPADNVLYWEQDGATRLISRSASMVASKGMVLCCSAGNEGDGTWKRTGCPADAKDVLAVGAIDFKGVNTRFSSLGHTADGRIKPDVMARGGNSAVMRSNGVVGSANGTSFSSPILCGMVACLWQALPHLTSYELMELIRKNGNNASHPDNVYGYGVPDFYKAYGSVQYGR